LVKAFNLLISHNAWQCLTITRANFQMNETSNAGSLPLAQSVRPGPKGQPIEFVNSSPQKSETDGALLNQLMLASVLITAASLVGHAGI